MRFHLVLKFRKQHLPLVPKVLDYLRRTALDHPADACLGGFEMTLKPVAMRADAEAVVQATVSRDETAGVGREVEAVLVPEESSLSVLHHSDKAVGLSCTAAVNFLQSELQAVKTANTASKSMRDHLRAKANTKKRSSIAVKPNATT